MSGKPLTSPLPPKMKKKQIKIQADDETVKRLNTMAAELGDAVTPNGIAAMAAYEISRVKADALWQALGAIRQVAEERPAIPAGTTQRRLRGAPEAALTVVR